MKKENLEAGKEAIEEAMEDKRILDEAKVSAFILTWFDKWCKDTKRSGGILVTTSIKELLTDFYAHISGNQAKQATPVKRDWETLKLIVREIQFEVDRDGNRRNRWYSEGLEKAIRIINAIAATPAIDKSNEAELK